VAVDLAHAGGDVAADGDDLEGGVEASCQRAAAQAPGAEAGAGGERGEREAGRGHQRVAGILARRGAGDDEAGWAEGGQILHAVHGEIDGAVEQALLDRPDEQTLAADLVERPILDAIPLGADDLEIDPQAGVLRPQRVANVVGLPQRQGGAARADANRSEIGHGPEGYEVSAGQ
jgi:hypothetical protein